MGESELKTALQREGEMQIRNAWQQSEAAVATRLKEIEAKQMNLQTETGYQLRAESIELSNNLLFAAEVRAK